jgi:diguanylate cyclase (GGDEF)-like protein
MVPINLLIIEDSEDDALLVVRALTQAGYDVAASQVHTADGLRDALRRQTFDVIVADYTMPGFSGSRALAMVREQGLDIPFIFVSGTIGEDVAVAAMKTGAHDYIVKGNLTRLAPAVDRELREAATRRELARTNERVAYLAFHDPLTDLPNRSLLQDRLNQAVLTMRREQKPLALLVLDLDGFKMINDGLGHHAGDRVLQQVAARLRRTLRQSDTIARLGGDEFAVLLPNTDVEGAVLAARKVLLDLEQPLVVDNQPLMAQCSIGIAGFPVHAAAAQELMQKADFAMYLAKADHSGFAVYTPDRDQHTEQRLALINALRRGIDCGQFVLEYQPIVALREGTVIGLEALIRWDHPEQGRLGPDDFIRAAEHTGLITPLTTFAIDLALAEWPTEAPNRPPAIAVNLSPRSLHDESFPARIQEMLSVRRVHPTTLALEITENLIMSDPQRSTRCLRELHDMGVQLIVDDFGTGYSSLSYLRKLPVDQLKIDRSFVIGLAAGEDDALVRSIIDLAHNLRLSVIAEGVETAAVRDLLLELGCDAAQGHFISRPAPAAVIVQWMANQQLPRTRSAAGKRKNVVGMR